jgi:hypothetical protein
MDRSEIRGSIPHSAALHAGYSFVMRGQRGERLARKTRRASIFFALMMDCGVKPGNDRAADAHSLSTVSNNHKHRL